MAANLDRDELEMFRTSMTEFVARKYTAEYRAELTTSANGYEGTQWQQFGEFGWLGIAIDPEFGGSGGGLPGLAVLMETVGRGLLMEPLLATLVLGAELIGRAGSQAQKAMWLPEVVNGATKLAFAHEESSDVLQSVSATADGARYCLSGLKRFVLHGPSADRLIVSAGISNHTNVGLFIIDPHADGVTLDCYRSIDGRPVADVHLDNVRVDVSNRLAGGDTVAIIKMVVLQAALLVCAEAVGTLASLNRMTLEYAKSRHQFGVAIGSFQVIQHKLVDMLIAEQLASSIYGDALAAMTQASEKAAILVSATKVIVSRAIKKIGEFSIQIHGGMGMTDELSVGHYFKRLLMIDCMFGNQDWHLNRFSELTRNSGYGASGESGISRRL